MLLRLQYCWDQDKEVYRRVRIALAKINSAISENISGMRIIQLFGREKQNYEIQRNRKEYKTMNEIVTFGLSLGHVCHHPGPLVWYGGSELWKERSFGTL